MTTFYFFILLANTMARSGVQANEVSVNDARFEVSEIIDRSQKIYTGFFNMYDAVRFGDDIIVYDYDFLKAASDKNSHEYEIAQRNYEAIAPVLRKRLNKIVAVCDYDDSKMSCILNALRAYDPNNFKDVVQEIDRSHERREREAKELITKHACEAKLLESLINLGFKDY